jgi:pantothenate kinase
VTPLAGTEVLRWLAACATAGNVHPLADHYPYLLVNIGSGVSMVRVDGEGKFQRVSGVVLLRLCGVYLPDCHS